MDDLDFLGSLAQMQQAAQASLQPPTPPVKARVEEASVPKQAAVAEASAAKRTALTQQDLDFGAIVAHRETGRGALAFGEIGRALAPSQSLERILQYGSDVERALNLGQSEALLERRRIQTQEEPTLAQQAGEAALDLVGGGILDPVGHMGAWVVGQYSPAAGAYLADSMAQGQQLRESLKSRSTQDQNRLTQQQQELAALDSQILRQQDTQQHGDLLSSLRQIGRDTLSDLQITLESPAALRAGTAQGVGTILTGSVIGRTLAGLAGRATTGELTIPTIREITDAMPVAIGLMEGSSTYVDTVNAVQAMPIEALREYSDVFAPTVQVYLEKGLEQDQAEQRARDAVAHMAGNQAAVPHAFLAGATGKMVARFEADPLNQFKRGLPSRTPPQPVKRAVTNIAVTEPLEEAIQGGSGEALSNLAIGQTADRRREWDEGVGSQLAQGALFGSLSAAAIQLPTGALALGMHGANKALAGTERALDALRTRAERIQKELEQASPVADTKLATAGEQAAAQADAALAEVEAGIAATAETTTPEERESALDYARTLIQSVQFDASPEALTEAGIDPYFHEILAGTNNRIAAVQQIAAMVEATADDPQLQLQTAGVLYTLLDPINNLEFRDEAAMAELPPEHIGHQINQEYSALFQNLARSTTVRQALDRITALLTQHQEQSPVLDVSEAALATPEGQQAVRTAVTLTQHHPDRANLATSTAILKHADEGRIQLDPFQRQALQASIALVQARRAVLDERARLGHTSTVDVVSDQVLTGRDPLRAQAKSAAQHTRDILQAYSAGNRELASAFLEDFRLFAQHMQNKLGAFNAHFQGGDPSAEGVSYQAIAPGEERRWYQSPERLKVHPTRPGSVNLVQTVALEANALADIYENLAEVFPELSPRNIQRQALDPLLDGPPERVVQDFKDGVRQVPSQTAEPTTEPATPQEPVAAPPVAEPAQTEPVPQQPTPTLAEAVPEPVSEPVAESTAEPELPPVGHYVRYKDSVRLVIRHNPDGTLQLADPRAEGSNQSVKVSPRNVTRTRHRPAAIIASERGYPVITTATGVRYSTRTGKRLADAPPPAPEPAVEPAVDAPVEVEPGPELEVEVSPEVEPATPAAVVAPDIGTARPKGLASLFPNLYRSASKRIRNFFLESFQIPSKQRSHLLGQEAPLAWVREAIARSDRLNHSNTPPRLRHMNQEILDQYAALLSSEPAKDGFTIGSLLAQLQEQMAAFLASDGLGEKFKQGTPIHRYMRGKTANLLEETADGFRYQPALLEAAALAGIQWLLAGQVDPQLDSDTVAGLFQIDDPVEIERLTLEMNSGLSQTSAVRAVAHKIRNYWGVTPVATMDKAYTDGIPTAMAAEILRAFKELGLINVVTVKAEIVNKDGERQPITFNRLQVERLVEDSPLRRYPNAIERAVLTEPEVRVRFGSERAPIPQTQLHTPQVKLTREQKLALELEANTPFRFNVGAINLFREIGEEGLLALFGTPDLDNRPMNVNHRRSEAGRNTQLVSAYRYLNRLLDEAYYEAQVTNTPLSELEAFFGYDFHRANRMQMGDSFNPQSSTLLRELILPTRSLLDLTDAKHRQAFQLALAQALDIKVHNLPPETSTDQVQALLDGALAPAVRLLQGWLQAADTQELSLAGTGLLRPAQLTQLKEAFAEADVPLTPVALHALLEYARSQGLTEAERQAFQTDFYLEADGMTNGPGNALMLLSTGAFDENQIANLRRIGLSIGAQHTAAGLRALDSTDLYQAATRNTITAVDGLRQALRHNQPVRAQMEALLSLLDQFLPDLSLAEDGTLSMTRNLLKNPLTVILYGAGNAGIAHKLVETLSEQLYQRMSAAVQRQAETETLSPAEAMFPGAADPEAEFQRFLTNLQALTRQVTAYDRKAGQYVLNSMPAPRSTGRSLAEFTLAPQEVANLAANVELLLVEPMVQGITDTMGPELMANMRLIRQATQAPGLLYSMLFQQELAALRERRQKDPHFRKGEFISQADLDEIHAKLARAHITPLVQSPGQRSLISKQAGISINELNFARALDDSFATPAEVQVPVDPGVAGIPNLVIGMGDGLTMLAASLMQEIQGTLKIFDGVNMPLDKITDYSPLLNQAVWQSWQVNPFRSIEQMLTRFLNSPLLAKTPLSPEQVFEVLVALHGQWEATEMVNSGLPLTVETLREELKLLKGQLHARAQAKDARLQVLAQIPFSLDQMAAAGAPYVHRQAQPQETALSISGTVTRLNELLATAAETPLPPANPLPPLLIEQGHLPPPVPNEETPAAAPVREAPPELTADPELNTALDLLSEQEPVSRARVVRFTTLMRQHQTLPLTEEQRVIFDEIRRSGVLDGFTVVYGDAAQVNAHRNEQGLEPLTLDPEATTHGAVDVDAQVIYLLTDAGTTLVHEMIHGATFLTVLDYYRNPSKYKSSPVRGAIERLEGLLQEFLALGEPAEGAMQRSALQQAQAVVQSALLDPTLDQATARATALNEFMAWALTEPELTAQLKLRQAPAWVQLAQKVITEIKRLVWGRKWSPKVGSDSLSNLQFNTAILVRAQRQPLAAALQTTALYHQSRGPGLANPRLHALRELFGARLARFLDTDLPGPEEQRGVAQTHAQSLLQEALAAGFDLTPEAQGVFQMIITALGTDIDYDSSVLTRLQEVLVHTNKSVELADFMRNPEVNDPRDEYQALNKYNFFTGKFSTLTDTQGRSYLLPVFVALAATNEEVRSILQTKAVSRPDKRLPGTQSSADAVVDSYLGEAMHQLTTRLAGDHSAKNVQQAVDQLIQGLQRVNQYEENLIERHTNRANDYLVEKLGDLSDKGVALAERLDQSEQQLTRFTGSVIGLMSRLISSRHSDNLSEGLQHHMNKENLWEPYRAFVSDLLGRTNKNASIYDMIKYVRTAVQQLRQRHRDTTPNTIAAQFSRPLQAHEWAALTQGLAKTHIVSLARGRTKTAVRELLSSPVAVRNAIQSLEAQVSQHFGQHWATGQRKAKQLATFLMTEERGENLLRNAKAVSRLYGEVPHHQAPRFSPEQIQELEQLITLYALEQLAEADRNSIQNLLHSGEAKGIDFLMDFLLGQDKDERRRAQGTGAEINGYMGYLPLLPEHGGHLTVQDASEHAAMLAKGYVPIGSYERSTLDPSQHQLVYYYSANPREATFNQGLMQTVRQTAFGVDRLTGFSQEHTVGRITDPRALKRYRLQLARGTASGTPLSPVWNSTGQLVALERTIAPEHLARLKRNTQLHQMLAVWWGRQVEEAMGQEINQQLVLLLREQYDQALSENRQNQRDYVDLFSSEVQANDPVIRDAIRLMPPEMRELVKEQFGDQFWVERGLVKDVIGERSASVGDFWTGTTRWSEATQRQVRQLATTVFGKDAYRYLTQAERLWQGLMADARSIIVVKSVIVPMFNFVSSMLQLVSRGVSLLTIGQSLPKKLVEVEAYVRSYTRLVEAEAELRSVDNRPLERRKLMNEIRAIHDSHQRMSIWPLIQAGELSTIADLGQTREDLQLVRNDLSGYMKSKIDRLSPGARDTVRYGFITRGTPLFRALQKSVQYGDFLAKAILFDFLVHTKGKTVEEALGQITDEFVHYDKLPGRARSALENNGLLWFYNFKIRAAKVAVSTVRENPLNALVAALMPLPGFLESSGTAVTDNIFSQAAEGTLGYSIGPGMAVRAPTLLPWYQLVE